MLYKFNKETKELMQIDFYDYSDLNGKEKDLENLLAENLSDLFTESGQLMPIFQERPQQAEPDLCALDASGNLVIFELKRGVVLGDTTNQIMRYAQDFGQKSYSKLNELYCKYLGKTADLRTDHQSEFQLAEPLDELAFNRHQKMLIVGNSSDIALMHNVDYWKEKGIDIDFLPYRFYKINGEIYFEFYAKPYDYHLKPSEAKGYLFDTNRKNDENAIWDMLCNSKVSAYGNATRFIKRLKANDFIFYYHSGYGIVAAGIVKNGKPIANKEHCEEYCEVELLTPIVKSIEEIKCIPAYEISKILSGKTFFYRHTIKTPSLSIEESSLLLNELKQRYQK